MQNDHKHLITYRDTSAGYQLIPYYPGQNHVEAYRPKTSRNLLVSGDPAPKYHKLFFPPTYSGQEKKLGLHQSAYNSNRHIVTPKINQVGLLIDIYA